MKCKYTHYEQVVIQQALEDVCNEFGGFNYEYTHTRYNSEPLQKLYNTERARFLRLYQAKAPKVK